VKLPGARRPKKLVCGRRGTQRSLAGSQKPRSVGHLSVSLLREYFLMHTRSHMYIYICVALSFWQSQTLLMLIESHNLWPARLISCCTERGYLFMSTASAPTKYTTCKIKKKSLKRWATPLVPCWSWERVSANSKGSDTWHIFFFLIGKMMINFPFLYD